MKCWGSFCKSLLKNEENDFFAFKSTLVGSEPSVKNPKFASNNILETMGKKNYRSQHRSINFLFEHIMFIQKDDAHWQNDILTQGIKILFFSVVTRVLKLSLGFQDLKFFIISGKNHKNYQFRHFWRRYFCRIEQGL